MATGGAHNPVKAVQQGGSKDQRREEIQNGLLPMPGVRNTLGGGARAKYDGSGAFLLGETVCTGTLYGVWGEYGARIYVSPSTGAAREGNGQEMALGNQGYYRGSRHLQDGFTNLWEKKELLYRGVLGTGDDADGYAGSFLSPSCPGHRHHIGEGKPPPPMVPLVQHAGALEST